MEACLALLLLLRMQRQRFFRLFAKGNKKLVQQVSGSPGYKLCQPEAPCPLRHSTEDRRLRPLLPSWHISGLLFLGSSWSPSCLRSKEHLSALSACQPVGPMPGSGRQSATSCRLHPSCQPPRLPSLPRPRQFVIRLRLKMLQHSSGQAVNEAR